MKIVNLSLLAPYNENWGYHENLLPKWQKKNGNEVTLITTRFINNKNNDGLSKTHTEVYTNEDGVKVIRLDWLADNWIFRTLRLYKKTYETIEKEHPDFIFIHGCQFLDAVAVCRYLKKHPRTKAVVDNHSDETNSAMSFFPKLLHFTLWRLTANLLNRRVICFYGVLPVRCAFLTKYYRIPSGRIRLLPMGADDDLIADAERHKNGISEKLGFNPDLFNIACGGKFDHFKTEILELMKAVNQTDDVHLYVYGSIGDEIKDRFDALLSDRITYVGWIDQLDSYSLLLLADLAVFPGRHSVIWEQCVGLGVPLLVKDYPGTRHVDIGGNCIFLAQPDKDSLLSTINGLRNNPEKLAEMKKAAQSDKKNAFCYSEIAKRSVES